MKRILHQDDGDESPIADMMTNLNISEKNAFQNTYSDFVQGHGVNNNSLNTNKSYNKNLGNNFDNNFNNSNLSGTNELFLGSNSIMDYYQSGMQPNQFSNNSFNPYSKDISLSSYDKNREQNF